MNVAITRARRSVTIVCDSATVKHHPFLREMLQYAEKYGDYRAAVAEYPDIVGHGGNSRVPIEAVRASNKTKKGKKSKNKPVSKHPAGKSNDFAKASTVVSAKTAHNVSGPVGRKKNNNEMAELDTSHDRDNETCERMQKLVDMFANSSMEEHSFPKSFSSFERRIIHELAEARKLGHETTGSTHGRVIRIWKIPDEHTLAAQEPEPDVESNATVQLAIVQEDHVGPSVGSGTVSNRNKLLHEAAMARMARTETGKDLTLETTTETETGDKVESAAENVEEDADEIVPVVKPKKTKRGKRKKGNRKGQKQEEEDFDAVLKEYGVPQPKEIRDPVIRIMNGTLKVDIPGASSSKKPTAAQEKLAKKLAEAAKERAKKQKGK